MSDLISREDAIETVAQEWLSEASAESPYVNDDDIGEYRKLAEKLFEDVPSAEAVHIHNDGTLEVKVPNAQKVGRVLVKDADSHIGGGLFYPDDAVGEWIFNPTDAIDLMFAKPKCSRCGFESSDGGNFCPNCGADMRGEEE